MNKTVNVNLGGRAFILEEPAYQKLEAYLDALKKALAREADAEEILQDIEQRISDLLLEQLREPGQPITADTITPVLEQMGSPEDVAGLDAEDTSSRETSAGKKPHRLMRDPDNKVIGGVCGGIAAYFGWDPVWVRLVLVVLLLFEFFLTFGSIFLSYIIAWIIIPQASTRAEKLEMRGEPVTASSLRDAVQEETEHLQRRYRRYTQAGSRGRKFQDGLARFSGFLSEVFRSIFRIFGKTLGVILIAVAILALLSLVVGMVAAIGSISFVGFEYGQYMLGSQALVYVALASALLVLGIPLLAMLFAILRLVFGARLQPMAGKVMLAGWGAALFVSIGITVYATSGYSARGTVGASTSFWAPRDTFRVGLYRNPFNVEKSFFGDLRVFESDTLSGRLVDDITMEILPARQKDDSARLETNIRAEGRFGFSSETLQKSIVWPRSNTDSSLRVNPEFLVKKGAPYARHQGKLGLYLPKGKMLWLSRRAASKLALPGPSDAFYARENAFLFRMGDGGLKPVANPMPEKPSFGADALRSNMLKDFDEVEANGCFDLKIIQGDEHGIAFRGDEDAIDRIDYKLKGNELEIRTTNNKMFEDGGVCEVTIELMVEDLHELTVNGASNIYIDTLRGERVEINLNGASEIEAHNLQFNELELEIKGAGDAKLSGYTRNMKLSLSGAGEIDALMLESEEAEVSLSGAADADVWVKKRIRSDLSGASDLRIKGGATIEGDRPGQESWGPSIERIRYTAPIEDVRPPVVRF